MDDRVMVDSYVPRVRLCAEFLQGVKPWKDYFHF